MRRRDMLSGAAGAFAAGARAAPRPPGGTGVQTPSDAEQAATIDALRPPKRSRPVVVVAASNAGAETTDLVVPFGVLAASGAAEVVVAAPDRAPAPLHPALRIEPQTTFAAFAAAVPDGADYVVAPALHRRGDPAVLAFIKAQHAAGATIVGICAGALTLSRAGLLRDRAATTHWSSVDDLRKENPRMRWARDRRYVVDRGVATTTGVSASIPVSLALVEAIAGRERAAALARDLGATDWGAAHDSDAFRLSGRLVSAAVAGRLAFWRQDRFAIPIRDGVDEIALALTADVYSRTWRSRALATAPRAVTSLRGLRILPDAVVPPLDADALALPRTPPADALPEALAGVERRYGRDVADFVALQLEFRRG